jgi:branched-chain amino acid transport system permease protein
LSLQTELWAFYAGTLFLATVMFFPGGLAGLIMMHVPAFRLGKARLLVLPYIKTLLPGLMTILGISALVEMIFHYRHAPPGDEEMTLFWTTFDSHALVPWIIALSVAILGGWLTKRNSPGLVEAWHAANTPTRVGTKTSDRSAA